MFDRLYRVTEFYQRCQYDRENDNIDINDAVVSFTNKS